MYSSRVSTRTLKAFMWQYRLRQWNMSLDCIRNCSQLHKSPRVRQYQGFIFNGSNTDDSGLVLGRHNQRLKSIAWHNGLPRYYAILGRNFEIRLSFIGQHRKIFTGVLGSLHPAILSPLVFCGLVIALWTYKVCATLRY